MQGCIKKGGVKGSVETGGTRPRGKEQGIVQLCGKKKQKKKTLIVPRGPIS